MDSNNVNKKTVFTLKNYDVVLWYGLIGLSWVMTDEVISDNQEY